MIDIISRKAGHEVSFSYAKSSDPHPEIDLGFLLVLFFRPEYSDPAVYREVDRHGIANGAHAVAQRESLSSRVAMGRIDS